MATRKTKRKTARASTRTQQRSEAARPGPRARTRAASSAATPLQTGTPVPSASDRLPRAHKSRRAQFYQDPAIDQLWAVATALAAEVSVLYDRLDTVERLLERDGSVSQATIEAFRPNAELAQTRVQRREELIERVFQVLDLYGR